MDESRLADGCDTTTVTRYRLRTGDATTQAARRTTRPVTDAIEHKDWVKLYEMLAPLVSSGFPQAEFVAGMQTQAPGDINGVRTVGDGELSRSSGISTWAQKIQFKVTPPGQPAKTYTAVVLLTFEAGEWRFASTTEPVPS